jgi:hypothetical protein
MLDKIRQIGFPMVDLSKPEIFARNMAFMHDLMIASEPLVQEAIDHADGELRDYLVRHIEEERGHAAWLAEDLAELGLTEWERSCAAVACAGSQYYWIKHVHPAAVLGYMAILEGYPMPIETVEELELIHGTKACRTLRYHAENDVEHRIDLFEMIGKLPEHAGLIETSAMQTLNLLHAGLN